MKAMHFWRTIRQCKTAVIPKSHMKYSLNPTDTFWYVLAPLHGTVLNLDESRILSWSRIYIGVHGIAENLADYEGEKKQQYDLQQKGTMLLCPGCKITTESSTLYTTIPQDELESLLRKGIMHLTVVYFVYITCLKSPLFFNLLKSIIFVHMLFFIKCFKDPLFLPFLKDSCIFLDMRYVDIHGM